MDHSRTILEAEGLATLGLYAEALEVLRSLPDSELQKPFALAVRLTVCAGLRYWEAGTAISKLITPAHPLSLREAAGKFHLAHAVERCEAGELFGAKVALAALSVVWPEGGDMVAESESLKAL